MRRCRSWMAFFNCMIYNKKDLKKIHPIHVTQDQQQQPQSEPPDISTPRALVNVDFRETPSKKVETPPSMNTQTASDTSLETPPPSLGDQPHKRAGAVAPILPKPKHKASTLGVVRSPREKERPPYIDHTSSRTNTFTLYEPPTAEPRLHRPKKKPEIVSDGVKFLGCYIDR